VRTLTCLLAVLGCRPAKAPINPETEQVYKAESKMRFINEPRPGGLPDLGTLEGIMFNSNREPMIGCNVVLSSPALVGVQVVITDEAGKYLVEKLPPGAYRTTYYCNNATFENPTVHIRAGQITVEHVLDVPANIGDAGSLL
jgi:hypothetical protein